jgi:hypothetical protein
MTVAFKLPDQLALLGDPGLLVKDVYALDACRVSSPWTAEETDVCLHRLTPTFVIRDHNGQALSCVYFADEPDEVRKIAAELPELAEMKSPGSSCLKEVASEAPGLPVQTGPGVGKTRCTELA